MATLTVIQGTQIEYISKIDLMIKLNQINKPTFCFMVFETIPRMRKTNNPNAGLLIKRSSGRFLIGNSYELRMNNHLKKEGKEPNYQYTGLKSNDVHVSKCVIYNNNTGKYYLQAERFNKQPAKVKYLKGENEVNENEVKPFLSDITKPDIQFFEVTLENLREIRFNKVVYRIKRDI